MPSRKKQEEPWWFSPTVFDVVATDEVYNQSKLPPLLIQHILNALANKKYSTRPRHANKKWPETIYLDGAKYQLSCKIDQKNKKIVTTHISAPKEMRKPRRHR